MNKCVGGNGHACGAWGPCWFVLAASAIDVEYLF